MKEFFEAIRAGLDNFCLHIESTIQQYQRVSKASKVAKEEKRKSIVYSAGGPLASQDIIDTMGTSIESFVEKVSSFAKEMQGKADNIKKDLIEPLNFYSKHYTKENFRMLKQCNEIWTQLHQDRTQMLFAKENYYNQMYQLSQLVKMESEEGGFSKPNEGPSLTSQINFQQLSAQQSE